MTQRRSAYLAAASIAVITLVGGVSARAQGFPAGVRLEVGWAYGEMRLDDFAMFGPYDLASAMGSIRHAQGVELGLGYDVAAHVGLTVRSGYLRGSAEDTRTVFIPGEGDVALTEEWRLTAIPLSIGADYRWTRGSIAAAVEVAAEVYFLDWSLHSVFEGSSSRQGSDVTIEEVSVVAGRGGLAAEWAPIAQLAVGSRVGYRIAEQADFGFFTVDLNGLYVGAYVVVRPWGDG